MTMSWLWDPVSVSVLESVSVFALAIAGASADEVQPGHETLGN